MVLGPAKLRSRSYFYCRTSPNMSVIDIYSSRPVLSVPSRMIMHTAGLHGSRYPSHHRFLMKAYLVTEIRLTDNRRVSLYLTCIPWRTMVNLCLRGDNVQQGSETQRNLHHQQQIGLFQEETEIKATSDYVINDKVVFH